MKQGKTSFGKDYLRELLERVRSIRAREIHIWQQITDIFAGGKTIIDAHEEDIAKANITRVPAVLVQSRGVIDAVDYENPFTFRNEMWAYTHENKIAVKFLYYVLKNNIERFREAASGMGENGQTLEELLCNVIEYEAKNKINSSK